MGMRKFLVIGISIFITVLSSVFFSKYLNKSNATSNTTSLTPVTIVSEETRETPKGLLEYKNTTHGFSLLYPEGIVISEPLEDASTATITFQDVENGSGFQIFIVPNNSPRISEERFIKDVSSGVRTNVENTTVGITQAVSFHSEDFFLGETQEVWFIHEGFLYEVTTLRSLDEWIFTIMDTWLFL